MNWKKALWLIVGFVWLRYQQYRSYLHGYSNGYYQGRIHEIDAHDIAMFYMHQKNDVMSETEQNQVLAQQIAQDPLLEDYGDWDGIDRLSLYSSIYE